MNKNTTNNMNNDEAFMTLLSSQRELLKRMNMERNIRREHQIYDIPNNERRHGSIIGHVDPLSLLNTPIVEQRGNMDILFPNRISHFGVGNSFGIPPSAYNATQEETKKKALELSDPTKKTKRRRSSLGILSNALFWDEQQKHHQVSRRLSMISNLSGLTGIATDAFDQDFVFESFEPEPALVSKSVELDPNIPPETVRSNLNALASSMEKSTKSQLDIHAWDRKMGLKRSHSKTMRLTMRSRKKLRAILKKDINSLSQNTR